MFLHIGGEYLIQKEGILGIFDIENTTENKSTKEFLSHAQKQGKVVTVAEDLPRSFILYQHQKETTVFITQFSTSTLLKRSREGNEAEDKRKE